MKSKQGKKTPTPNTVYQFYDGTRAAILALSEMTETEIDDAATELSVDYQSFWADYKGPYLVDAHAGFLEMLRQWPVPWPAEITGLSSLTVEQFLLAWAWQENNAAKYLLDGEAVANGWKSEDAMECGVISAVSAAKSLFHAKSLLASGPNAMVPKTLPATKAGLRRKVAVPRSVKTVIRPSTDKVQGLHKS